MSISIIIISCILFSINGNSIISDIDEDTFLSIKNSNDRIIILFYINSFEQNNIAIDVFQKLAKSNKENINFGMVNCEKETKLCLSLNVEKVPEVIKFVNGKMKILEDYYTEHSLNKLIKSEDNFISIPSILNPIDYLLIFVKEGLYVINNILNEFFVYYDIPLVWSFYHSIGLFAFTTIIVIIVELWVAIKLWNICNKRLNK